jgi:DNA-directed RNA polymerase sigma subunit (sigma70/sigma32)
MLFRMGRPLTQPPAVLSERDAGIIQAVLAGETMVSVARKFGISRSRVAQICRHVELPEVRVSDSPAETPVTE